MFLYLDLFLHVPDQFLILTVMYKKEKLETVDLLHEMKKSIFYNFFMYSLWPFFNMFMHFF